MSAFKSLIIKLEDKLPADIPDSAGTPGIRLVDFDLGQIDAEGQRPSIASGGNVFINFISTTYIQKQLKAQWAEMNILLRLAFDHHSSTNSLAPLTARQKAFAFFDVENKLYLSLQDWTADGLLMLPMKRISATTEDRKDLFVRDIIFKCTYEDRSLALAQP